MKTSNLNARTVSFVGIMGAVSMVLLMLNFPLPFAPSFMKFDVADLPALFTGFFLGPVAGVLVAVVKILLKIIVQGSDTAFVGEFSNLTGSICFVLAASLIYRKLRSKKGAIISMATASVIVSLVYVLLNAYVMFPLYSNLYGLPMDVIIGMGSAVNPLVKDTLTMMLFAVLPFNLVKHAVVSVVTYLIYRKSANALMGILNISK